MRKTVFAILATTALLATGPLTRVEAMTPVPLGIAPANTDLVQQAAAFCGPRGYPHTPPSIVEPMGWPSWLEHLEWMPPRLDETGWKMRTL